VLQQDPRTTEQRIERFKRLGGIELGRLEQEELDPLLAHIHVGTQPLKKTVFSFRCELCGRVERSDNEMPPACTGPSWLDEHPLEPMTLIGSTR
jgi:hypothetical protein